MSTSKSVADFSDHRLFPFILTSSCFRAPVKVNSFVVNFNIIFITLDF